MYRSSETLMPGIRETCLRHPEARVYQEWEASLRGSASDSTVRQYTYEVARFLARALRRRLRNVTENVIINYRLTIPASSDRRAVSALGHFFQYALEHRLADVIYNPVYRARRKAAVEQPSLIDLMMAEDVSDYDVHKVRWIDVLVAIGETSSANKLRVGRRVIRLDSPLRHRLEAEFCRRITTRSGLSELLRSRIA
jgi:hypothetical protein